jgi:hypothetical protein
MFDQIQDDVSPRLKLWDGVWALEVRHPLPVEVRTDIDFSITTSGLHDCALAKIKQLYLQFKISERTHAMLGVYGLEILLKFKSLYCLSVSFLLEVSPTSILNRKPGDMENLPFLIGLVIRILSQIPTSVSGVGWYIRHKNVLMPEGSQDTLKRITEQYKSVRGTA